MFKLAVGITGATGSPLAVRLLQLLAENPLVETHVIISRWAKVTLELETDLHIRDVQALADHVHSADDQAAALASGSFPVDGVVIIPCSMKTLAGIRSGYAEGLIPRVADIAMKEGRPLVLVPRETPFNQIHLENMLALARMGVRIVPPMLTFYNNPADIEDMTDHIVTRILDQFGIRSANAQRWNGIVEAKKSRAATRANLEKQVS